MQSRQTPNFLRYHKYLEGEGEGDNIGMKSLIFLIDHEVSVHETRDKFI
jgi:hypothetical protein